eukprot:scaffold993_cov393-Prasinococcus_capsulatus_cf.AAC.12
MDRRPESETAKAQLLDGAWEVRYTTAPPPSNGQLGPFGGVAVQRIDMSNTAYVNELSIPSPEVVRRLYLDPATRTHARSLALPLAMTCCGLVGAEALADRTPAGNVGRAGRAYVEGAVPVYPACSRELRAHEPILREHHAHLGYHVSKAGRTMDAVQGQRGRGRAVNGVADDSVFVMTKAD